MSRFEVWRKPLLEFGEKFSQTLIRQTLEKGLSMNLDALTPPQLEWLHASISYDKRIVGNRSVVIGVIAASLLALRPRSVLTGLFVGLFGLHVLKYFRLMSEAKEANDLLCLARQHRGARTAMRLHVVHINDGKEAV